ncbi:MAG: hypothetical protein SVV80_10945 [Planctomycetota bacterium]|nr:hypothetical protein [Planctomycetota bacterium]
MESASETIRKKRDLPLCLWLGLPLASIALRLVAPAILDAEGWKQQMTEEFGLVQNLTVVFLLPAVVAGVLIFLRRRQLPRGVGWVMLFFALGALYFAGEEASWGQHWIGYETPEALKKINTQDEFNVHNVHNIFNNIPRQLMFVGTIGCIVIPLWLAAWPWLSTHFEWLNKRFPRLRPALQQVSDKLQSPQSAWYWLAPNKRLMLISLMVIFLRLPKRLEDVLGAPPSGSYTDMAFFQGSGEFKEYCYALVIMFYILSVYLRMRSRKPAPETDS